MTQSSNTILHPSFLIHINVWADNKCTRHKEIGKCTHAGITALVDHICLCEKDLTTLVETVNWTNTAQMSRKHCSDEPFTRIFLRNSA